MNKDAIVRLGFDITRGAEKFTVGDVTYTQSEAVDVLRQALIDANEGSTKFDYKSLRRNKAAIFEIIEELISVIVQEGITGSEFWNSNVDYRNLKLGDKNAFYVDGNYDFVVCEVAEGNATPRRQRIGKNAKYEVKTVVHSVRMYDHFARFMAGRIDWANLCERVAKSFQQEIWSDIYTAFGGVTATDIIGDSTTYLKTGSYDEATLIDLVEHVEASTGATATIYGTKAALRNVTTSITADSAKEDLYNQGYIGKFYGTNVYALKQVHKSGTDTFVLQDNVIYVVAGDDKFIKFVDEGETIIDDRDFTMNSDSTMEYRMTQKWGVAIAFSSKGFGRYTIS